MVPLTIGLRWFRGKRRDRVESQRARSARYDIHLRSGPSARKVCPYNRNRPCPAQVNPGIPLQDMEVTERARARQTANGLVNLEAAQERPALPIFYASPAAGFEQQVLTPETRSGRKPRPAHRFPMGTLRKLVAECIFWYRIRTTVGTVSCGLRDTRVVFTVSSPGRCVRITRLDCR